MQLDRGDRVPCDGRGSPHPRRHGDITAGWPSAPLSVSRTQVLGYGFWRRSLSACHVCELRSREPSAEVESEIRVTHKGVEVGFYKADPFVNERVIVELKVAKTFFFFFFFQFWPNQGRVQMLVF